MRHCTKLAINALRKVPEDSVGCSSVNPPDQPETELKEFCHHWLSTSDSVTQLPAMTALNLDHFHSGNHLEFIRFPSRRSVVHSTKGIVSSTQPLANEAGYKIFAKGGNAADAAVAVAAALNVTEPTMTGRNVLSKSSIKNRYWG